MTDEQRDAYGHTEADHEAAGACRRPSLDARVAASRAYPDPHALASGRIACARGYDAAIADLDGVLHECGIDYPTGLSGVRDLHDLLLGQRQRAEEAEREHAALRAGVKALADTYASLSATLGETWAGAAADLHALVDGATGAQQ